MSITYHNTAVIKHKSLYFSIQSIMNMKVIHVAFNVNFTDFYTARCYAERGYATVCRLSVHLSVTMVTDVCKKVVYWQRNRTMPLNIRYVSKFTAGSRSCPAIARLSCISMKKQMQDLTGNNCWIWTFIKWNYVTHNLQIKLPKKHIMFILLSVLPSILHVVLHVMCQNCIKNTATVLIWYKIVCSQWRI